MISRFLTGVFIENRGGEGLLIDGSERSCKPAKDIVQNGMEFFKVMLSYHKIIQ